LKRAILTLLLIASTAMAAARTAPPLPVPPIPPAVPPLSDAPVPDLDLYPPFDDGRLPPVTLNLGINRREPLNPSRGFPPGSAYRNDDDRHFFSLPGIMLHVPFP
jgi:hypothetical protein